MKIVLAQVSISSNYKKNLSKIIEIIEKNNFDILVFPELSLTSYNLKKSINISKIAIIKALEEIQKKVKRNKIVIVGTLVHRNTKIYNASAIISSKNIEYYYKNTLTKYDSVYFDAGVNNFNFKFKKFNIGILICRDQDNIELIKRYQKDNCDILLHQSAHYYKNNIAIKKVDKNISMPIVRAIDSKCLFCKVNTVGKYKKEISLGNSMIVNKEGVVLRKANQYKEEIIQLNIKDKK